MSGRSASTKPATSYREFRGSPAERWKPFLGDDGRLHVEQPMVLATARS
jgi:hypothetical protein